MAKLNANVLEVKANNLRLFVAISEWQERKSAENIGHTLQKVTVSIPREHRSDKQVGLYPKKYDHIKIRSICLRTINRSRPKRSC